MILEVAVNVESIVEILMSFLRKSAHIYCVYAVPAAAIIHALARKANAVPYAVFNCWEKLSGVFVLFSD
jgi:hypothetical protein